MTTNDINNPITPFVKWVGGKRQIITDIINNLPLNIYSNINCYVEPFIGGGAVLFTIGMLKTNISKFVINDINTNLINTYNNIKHSPIKLMSTMSSIEHKFNSFNTEEDRKKYYYELRNLYNQVLTTDSILISALFIFLNKTCFNGLYRVNSNNKFNVPFNNKKNISLFNYDNIININKFLQNVTILNTDYKNLLHYATPNSFFYLDPPYMPISQTSNFTSYSNNGFSLNDQYELNKFCININDANSFFLMSNSDPSYYDKSNNILEYMYANFNILKIKAKRLINANPNKRNEINELLIKNY